MKFSKMHGAGNDFSLFDGFSRQLPDYGALAKAVCDRHFGTGGDGIMIALPSEIADVKMVYYNSDGSRGEMCGNGTRCFAKFVYEKGFVTKTEFGIETSDGVKTVRLKTDDRGRADTVAVAMGRPVFDSKKVPAALLGDPVMLEPLEVDGRIVMVTVLRMGVPHCVVVAEDLDTLDIEDLGSKMERHPAFPQGINVNFIQVIDRRHIRIMTWERGAHHTLACGTGACASVVAGNLLGILDPCAEVKAEGGVLRISLSPEYDVTMEGTAEFICDGEYGPWVAEQIEKEQTEKSALCV